LKWFSVLLAVTFETGNHCQDKHIALPWILEVKA